MRAHVIERLVCDLRFDGERLRAAFGAAAEPCLAIASRVAAALPRHLRAVGPASFEVMEEGGRSVLRAVAANFDAYLCAWKGRYSST